MKKIIVLVILFFSTNVFGVAYTSAGSGRWSQAATWVSVPPGTPGPPVSGDTATIAAGHKVQIDGNVTVGTAPASISTYDLIINGQLYLHRNPTGNFTFTARSSVQVNSGGEILIGSGGIVNCANTFEWVFENSTSNQKYAIRLNSGKLEINGCTNYGNSAGIVTRARIDACAPDCAAGAGKTITLDRDVNWNASGAWVGDTIFFGVGGSAATPPAAADDPEYITSWAVGSATSISGVTFTEAHQIGDMVENASRNVVFRSDSQTYHSKVYSTAAVDGVYDINWVLFDEFGDGTSTSVCAINYSNSTHTFGNIDHTVLRNCSDGGTAWGFYISFNAVGTFTNNIVHDTQGGRGVYFTSTAMLEGPFNITNFSYYEGISTRGYGVYSILRTCQKIEGVWVAHGTIPLYFDGGCVDLIDNCLIHGGETYGIHLGYSYSGWSARRSTVSNNEIRNITSDGVLLEQANVDFLGNDIDNIGNNCVKVIPISTHLYAKDNTYDGCNLDNLDAQSAMHLQNERGWYYGENEHFGQATPNLQNNILWDTITYTDRHTNGAMFKGTCVDCLLAAPTGAVACSAMDTDGIQIYKCVSYYNVTFMGMDVYFALHNKDQVVGQHIGWGPGGMVFERETAIVQDSTIALKMTPGDATDYQWFEIGKTYVETGDALSVSLDLRKNEALVTTGDRPRLALLGSGFTKAINYDEMTDVTDTWETVTVSGSATYTNIVHIYVGVKNTLSGLNDYAATWPPTLTIYADKIVVTK